MVLPLSGDLQSPNDVLGARLRRRMNEVRTEIDRKRARDGLPRATDSEFLKEWRHQRQIGRQNPSRSGSTTTTRATRSRRRTRPGRESMTTSSRRRTTAGPASRADLPGSTRREIAALRDLVWGAPFVAAF